MAEPDWDNSHQWNEFEWEQALKNSEESSARFFRLLERFGDDFCDPALPDSRPSNSGIYKGTYHASYSCECVTICRDKMCVELLMT